MNIFTKEIKIELTRAVSCILGTAVVAGGMMGSAGVASAAAKPIYISGAEQGTGTDWIGKDGVEVVVDTVSSAKTYTSGSIYGKYSGDGNVSGGRVSVNDGTIDSIVYGGRGTEATGNTVIIAGGQIQNVRGGYGRTKAENNTVIVNGGTITGRVIGGLTRGRGRSASGNTVIVNGGEIKGVVYGARSDKATDNTVTITGGQINNVCGGHSHGGGTTENNTVNLIGIGGNMGGIRHTGDINISGYVLAGRSSSGPAANNTLNVYGQGTKVTSLIYDGGTKVSDYTQNLNFYIQDGLKYGDTMLTVAGADAVNLDGVKVGVNLQGVPAGDRKDGITLLHTESSSIVGCDVDKVEVNKGTMTFEGKVELTDSNKKLRLHVDELSGGVNENGKSLIETRAAAGAIVNSVSDFTMEQGMTQAKTAAKAGEQVGITEFVPFAAVGGSNMRYETGSHVDMKGWNISVGVAKKVNDVIYGVAVEYGTGKYDSYLDNGNHASGDIKATGGAIFAEQKKEDGIHWDAAIRAGRTNTDYKNDAGISYDDGASYYGFSFGGGKEFTVKDNSVVDFYGRFYYNHTNSSDVTSSDGNHNHFDAVNSKRIRVGTRYTYTLNDKNKLYAGLAWQHEFDGDARATINGVGAPAPSLKGNSGMLEVGWKVQASKNVVVDLNLNGWTGKQKGVTGGVGIQWTF